MLGQIVGFGLVSWDIGFSDIPPVASRVAALVWLTAINLRSARWSIVLDSSRCCENRPA